ncbi:MAG: zf-HC2 domain-containing protein [Candidatus Cloacimonadaceae bacterium]|jgi:anti-sigma factor RsiW|nr:zf-HC2 domain-containing protein [Candidatus Cloacimonadaceae bacterium]
MRCKTAELYISLRLDRELKPKHSSKLDEHLKHCSSCAAFLADTRLLQTRLTEIPEPVYPSWMHQRIMHNLPQPKARFWLFKPAFTISGATLAIACSLFFGALTGIRGYQESGYSAANPTQQTYQLSFGENSLMEMYDE